MGAIECQSFELFGLEARASNHRHHFHLTNTSFCVLAKKLIKKSL